MVGHLYRRAADTPSGVVLMGARLYNPTTGRFSRTDPIYGGSANPYDYVNGELDENDPGRVARGEPVIVHV